MKLLVALLFVCGLVAVSEANMFCQLCEDLIGGVEAEVEGDETNIIDKANAVCDKLTNNNQFLDPICRSIVDNSIMEVEEDIKNKEPPTKVCKKIHMC
uniref:Saposin B-type domain-containing protein n=1 Tax=Steinernema glaseri TaxID=37863 RepID=A0A1I8AVE0_9BILA